MPRYKKLGKNIHQVILDNPKTPDICLTWTNITCASKEEIEYLRKNYPFSLNHLRASSAKATAQRPLIEKTKDYLFIIIHFPVLQDNNIVAGEIEFFIGKDYLVTLHNNDLKSLNQFFSFSKKDGKSVLSYQSESSAILLYEILDKLLIGCYPMLDHNSIAIEEVEKLIFSSNQKQAVSKILSLRRNIVNIRKIMQNHKNIIKKLIQHEAGLSKEGEIDQIRKYYNRLLDHSKRIWEQLESQKEMIEVLNSTNESLLNYKISDIMKTLTIFSVIVFPLTLLAAIFGMNITDGMPLIHRENGFWIIIVIMFIGCLGMLVYFAKKKWL